MSYRVVVTERAERDLEAIGDWLHERSPDGAKRWLLAAWQAIDSLGEKAAYCPKAPENEHCDREIRNILFKTPKGRTYRAVFVIESNRVIVTHVRGPGQDAIPNEEFDQN